MPKKFLHHICQTVNLARICKTSKSFVRRCLRRIPWELASLPITPLKRQKLAPMSTTYKQSTDTTTFRTPADIQKTSERNTIQLLAKEAIKGSGVLHYYYLYTDNNGKQTYLSAYPEKTNYPWGKLVTKTGTYKDKTPDFQDSVSIGTIGGSAKEVAQTFQSLKTEFTRVETAGIKYNSLSNGLNINNSNSVAATALYNCVANSQIQLQDGIGPREVSSLNDRAIGQATQILQPATSNSPAAKSTEKSSATTDKHKSILAMYSADGTANGKIDVSKMIQELQTAKYSKEDITAVLNTMYEIQNVPAAQRSQLAATAIESANKTASATPTVDRQATL
jgi:hypothetical protein